MSGKFTELLDGQRLRALWQPQNKSAQAPAAQTGDSAAAAGVRALGGPHLTRESLRALLPALEKSLRHHLGGSALLLENLLRPLRAALARKEDAAALGQSLPRPTTDTIFAWIDRIDDTATCLLALKKRRGDHP